MSGKLVDVSGSNIIIIIGHVFWLVVSIRLTKSQSYQGVVFGSVSINIVFGPIIFLIGHYYYQSITHLPHPNQIIVEPSLFRFH